MLSVSRAPVRLWAARRNGDTEARPLVMFLLAFCVALFLPSIVASAAEIPETAQANLEELAANLRVRSRAARTEARALALRQGWPLRQMLPDGRVFALMALRGGRPLYYTTCNALAADTVGTDELWPGGSTGLNLTGADIRLGIWDEAAVRCTHQELSGRVTQRDGAMSLSSHATHVAGTMIASGVKPAAKGMSFAATLDAYDWDDDDAEMAAAAASGLCFSNHSYSYIHGWYYNFFGDNRWAWFGDPAISPTEDYTFGFYDETAALWDNIAFNAPHYLIVRAAGNDRSDTGPAPGTEHWVFENGRWVLSTATRDPDGGITGYDTIGDAGVAKNILTIGAVNDIVGGYTAPGDVVMTSFSSWGPTDDGRIKPDLVANGTALYSCVATNNTAYASYSGTSMATPNTTGTLGLLLQHYLNVRRATPRAATMKALVIHTANEAGTSPGPDYRFGWGLLNAVGAAQVITSNAANQAIIREEVLPQGGTFMATFVATGTEPFKVTIAWTDPPGTPPPPSVDPPTQILVNDLDLRVERDGTIYYPWVLDPSTPAAAATTGDNNRDNVEQVLITTPTAGRYTVTVSHKGTLRYGTQAFSLIATGCASGDEHRCLLQAGWNLVSIPLELGDPARDLVFPPGIVIAVWEYDAASQQYVVPEEIHPKKGYWVKAAANCELLLRGTRPADKSVRLQAGWNLVGVVGRSGDEPRQPVPTEPSIAALWECAPPYRVPRTWCEDGCGFWMRASQPVNIWNP